MSRGQIAHEHGSFNQLQAAMPPAEPAVVETNGHLQAATQFTGKSIDDELAWRSRRILAEEFDLHG